MEHLIDRPDGRVLAIEEDGAENGWPVIWHHGTPASRVLSDRDVALAKEQGIRLINFDRPGYGESTARPGRRVVDVVDDVVAIADALGIDRFGTIGISGGGPHVLACAARLPDRVTAAVSLASVAPYEAENLEFLAGMGEQNIEEFAFAVEGREKLDPYLEELASGLRNATAEQIADELTTLLPPVDRESVTGALAQVLERSFHRAVMNGIDGWRDDDLAFVRAWGFGVEEITVPVQLWQGKVDLMVPFAHGVWLAERIPNVDARILGDEGHLSILDRKMREIHQWLLAHTA